MGDKGVCMIWKISRFVLVRERESTITRMYEDLSWLQSVARSSGPGLSQSDVDNQQRDINYRQWQLRVMIEARTRFDYIQALRLTVKDFQDTCL